MTHWPAGGRHSSRRPRPCGWAAEGYRRLLRDGEGGWIEEQIERYTARLAAPEQPRGKREVGYAHA